MAYLEIIGSDNVEFDEEFFEDTVKAFNDPAITIINLPLRSIKKTVIAQVVSTPPPKIIPPAKKDDTIEKLRMMV